MKKILFTSVLLSTALMAHGAEMKATSLLGDYELVEFRSPLTQVELPVQPAITLSIARGGKLSGFAACNRYFGRLSASPLSIASLGTTRKMCHDAAAMKLEQTYLAALAQVNALERVSATELVLRDAQQQSLHFKMRVKPVEKVIWIGPEKKDCVAGVMKTQCLQYKTSSQGQWFNFYGQIEGFDWEAGKAYRLKVREEKIANPPADASSIKTSLVEVLSSQ
jgi:heat shock protein HslJ